jgi:hypothetical protein
MAIKSVNRKRFFPVWVFGMRIDCQHSYIISQLAVLRIGSAHCRRGYRLRRTVYIPRETRLEGSDDFELGRIITVEIHRNKYRIRAEWAPRAERVCPITILELRGLQGDNLRVRRRNRRWDRGRRWRRSRKRCWARRRRRGWSWEGRRNWSSRPTWRKAESRITDCPGTSNEKADDQHPAKNSFSI